MGLGRRLLKIASHVVKYTLITLDIRRQHTRGRTSASWRFHKVAKSGAITIDNQSFK